MQHAGNGSADRRILFSPKKRVQHTECRKKNVTTDEALTSLLILQEKKCAPHTARAAMQPPRDVTGPAL